MPYQRLAPSVVCVRAALFEDSFASSSKGVCFVSVPILFIVIIQERQKPHMKAFMNSLELLMFSNTDEFKNYGELYTLLYGVMHYFNTFQEC